MRPAPIVVDAAVAEAEAAARQCRSGRAGRRASTHAQNGCSPWSSAAATRPTLTSVRCAAIRRARPRIARRRTPAIAARPVRVSWAGRRGSPQEVGGEALEAVECVREEGAVVQALRDQRVASASMKAVSRVGPDRSHSTPSGTSARSSRTGLTLTNSTPALAQLAEPVTRMRVVDGAARVDLASCARHAAEGDEQLAVLAPARDQRRVLGASSSELGDRRCGSTRAAGGEAVGVHERDVAAERR